ncbi:MAG TPA: hypothetical protein VMH83_04750 [Candidatus Acidoferrum sp.]|nr:hypothetical protein [Candidatus Acidoferrum sp.]
MELKPSVLFEPYATRLEQFASRHNLQIYKYKHDMPMWNFYFQNPLGGCGRIDIQINNKPEVWLLKYCDVYDCDQSIRLSKLSEPMLVINPLNRIEEVILEAIRDVLDWKLSDLGFNGKFPLPEAWKTSQGRPKYPKPVL